METLQEQLDRLIRENRHWCEQGKPADYIPELSKQDPNLLGISICDLQGKQWHSGDCDIPFTIQSISKVTMFICMLLDNTFEDLMKTVSVSPTADGFNSIVNLEIKNEQRPLNPNINSGAIAGLALVQGKTMEDKYERVFDLIKKMTGNDRLVVNTDVYQSEIKTGDRNRALAYFMKSTGIIHSHVEDLLDIYFRLCSIEVTCSDISRMAAVLANDGKVPWNGEQIFDKKTAQITKAVMTTSGMYNASGEFAVEVGLPGKSGVGGGIMAVSPKNLGIAVFGPALDPKGNSIAGWKLLECLSNEKDLSIF